MLIPQYRLSILCSHRTVLNIDLIDMENGSSNITNSARRESTRMRRSPVSTTARRSSSNVVGPATTSIIISSGGDGVRSTPGDSIVTSCSNNHGSPSPSTAAASNDRVNMLLMEANEISQYLNEDYVRVIFISVYRIIVFYTVILSENIAGSFSAVVYVLQSKEIFWKVLHSCYIDWYLPMADQMDIGS